MQDFKETLFEEWTKIVENDSWVADFCPFDQEIPFAVYSPEDVFDLFERLFAKPNQIDTEGIVQEIRDKGDVFSDPVEAKRVLQAIAIRLAPLRFQYAELKKPSKKAHAAGDDLGMLLFEQGCDCAAVFADCEASSQQRDWLGKLYELGECQHRRVKKQIIENAQMPSQFFHNGEMTRTMNSYRDTVCKIIDYEIALGVRKAAPVEVNVTLQKEFTEHLDSLSGEERTQHVDMASAMAKALIEKKSK